MSKSNISIGLDIGTTKIVAMIGELNEYNKIKILGVTILTSLNDKSVKQVGYSNNIKHMN